MLTATRRFTFDAAHTLPRHAGKCSRLHGHTYILEVTVKPMDSSRTDELMKDQGFFVDFGDLKVAVNSVIDLRYDHYNLNETADPYPTAERLVVALWDEIAPRLPLTCKLHYLKLYETPNNWVEYTK